MRSFALCLPWVLLTLLLMSCEPADTPPPSQHSASSPLESGSSPSITRPSVTPTTPLPPSPSGAKPALVPPPLRVPPGDTAAVRARLKKYWYSNGHTGYFWDAPDEAMAVDVYQTLWWLRVATAQGQHTSLDAATVQRRARQVLTAQQAGENALLNIRDAVELVAEVGGEVDQNLVVGALRRYETQGGYSWTPGGKFDLAATATAAEIMRAADIPLSSERFSRVTLDLRPGPGFDGLTVAGAQIAVHGRASDAVIDAVTREIATGSMSSQYLGTAKRLGFHIPPPGQRQCAADPSVGGWRTDPHLLHDRLLIGCGNEVEVPPHSSAGWPMKGVSQADATDTLYGLQLAHATGVAGEYERQLGWVCHEPAANPRVRVLLGCPLPDVAAETVPEEEDGGLSQLMLLERQVLAGDVVAPVEPTDGPLASIARARARGERVCGSATQVTHQLPDPYRAALDSWARCSPLPAGLARGHSLVEEYIRYWDYRAASPLSPIVMF